MGANNAGATSTAEIEVLLQLGSNGNQAVEASAALALSSTAEIIPIDEPPTQVSKYNQHRNKFAAAKTRAIEQDDHTRLYLDETGEYELITKEQEIELAKRIELGREADLRLVDWDSDKRTKNYKKLKANVIDGELAKREFAEANLRLVISIAKRYARSGTPLLDLIQEGNFGLLHAVEKFDWRKGFKFSTYATWWIGQAITRGSANLERSIRLPMHAHEAASNIHKAQNRLELKLGRAATFAEIAIEVEMPEDRVIEVLKTANRPVSFNVPIGEKAGHELSDTIEDRTINADFQKVEAVQALSLLLDPDTSPLEFQENVVLRLFFGIEDGEAHTLKEIAELLGMPHHQVSAIKATALDKLRPYFDLPVNGTKKKRKKAVKT